MMGDLDVDFDLVTSSRGRAVVLTEGLAPVDLSRGQAEGTLPVLQKTKREQAFPTEIVQAGLQVRVQDGEASREEDRMHILNSICRRPLHSPPVKQHPSYDMINAKLRCVFAVATFRNAVQKGVCASLRLPEVISADQWLEHLILDVNSLPVVKDTDDFGKALVGLIHLKSLHINLSNCQLLSCMKGLGSGLGPHLSNLFKCMLQLHDAVSIQSLRPIMKGARAVPQLRQLTIEAPNCTSLHDSGVEELAGHKTLETVELTLIGCTALADPSQFWRGLGFGALPALTNLQINTRGCLKLPWPLQRLFLSVEALVEAAVEGGLLRSASDAAASVASPASPAARLG